LIYKHSGIRLAMIENKRSCAVGWHAGCFQMTWNDVDISAFVTTHDARRIGKLDRRFLPTKTSFYRRNSTSSGSAISFLRGHSRAEKRSRNEGAGGWVGGLFVGAEPYTFLFCCTKTSGDRTLGNQYFSRPNLSTDFAAKAQVWTVYDTYSSTGRCETNETFLARLRVSTEYQIP